MRGEVFRKELELEAGCDCFNSLGRNSERKCKPWVQLVRRSGCHGTNVPLVFTDNSFLLGWAAQAEGRAPWHNDTNGSLPGKILNTFQDSLNRCFAFFLIQLNPIPCISVFQIDLQCWEQGFNKVSGADHSEKSPN